MIVTPRCFSAEVLRRGLRTFTPNVMWITIRFPLPHHLPVHHFLSVVLQCHVVRRHSIEICGTHHWKLRCKPRWADMTKTSRVDHQLVLLGFPLLSLIGTRLVFPFHPCTEVSCCLPAKISRVPHQLCSLEINLSVVLTCLDLDTNH